MWIDRITGRTAERLVGEEIPGRWLLNKGRSEVVLNGRVMGSASRVFLVPDRQDSWQVQLESGFERGRFVTSLLPRALEVAAIRQVAHAAKDARSLAELLRVTPLPADLDDQIGHQFLDGEIGDRLPHLVNVCHRPRMRLKIENLRMPVGRAKRIPPRSLEYLASHSEDWRRRTPMGVEPTHVIAETIEDDVDLYENRVAVVLVEKILIYLQRRLQDLQDICLLLEDEQSFYKALEGGNYRLATRICELWGEIYTTGDLSGAASSVREKVVALRRQVLRLKRTKLCRQLKVKTWPSRELLGTNILVNDSDYREVADLWRAYMSEGEPEPLSDEEIFDDWQAANANFVDFCQLIVLRAMSEIGWRPVDSERFDRAVINLNGPGNFAVKVSIDEARSIVVTSAEHSVVFVPLLASLGRSTDLIRLRSTLEKASSDTSKSGVVVLYIGHSTDCKSISHSDADLANLLDSECLQRDGITFLPVGPFEITSLEKVGRTLNQFLRPGLFARYPPDVRCPSNLAGFIDLRRNSIPISVDEWSLRAPIDSVDLDEARGKLSSLDSPEVRRRIGNVSDNARGRFLEALSSAEELFRELRTCPVCRAKGNAFEPRDHAFRCICARCDSEWGRRNCSSCAEKISYILPNKALVSEEALSEHGGLDRTFGRDCIAVPKVVEGTFGLLCARCAGAVLPASKA